jgi:hypothetical protein
MTARGPVIVEVNARLGGDLIPYLGKLATGIDPGDVAVTIATGRRPSLESRLSQCVGIRFVYPPEDCVVRTIELPQPGRTSGLKLSRPMVAPGTKLALPPRAHLGRLAYLICEGANAVECERRLDQAVNAVRIEYERI